MPSLQMTATATQGRTIERLSSWPCLLNNVVEANRNTPFSWGEQNCCLWAARVVEVLTGVDVAVGLRKKCASAISVRRLLREFGGVANLASEVLPEFGIMPIPVVMAKRGDVVLADTPLGCAAGVCLGVDAAFPGATGLVFLKTSNCTHAFSV